MKQIAHSLVFLVGVGIGFGACALMWSITDSVTSPTALPAPDIIYRAVDETFYGWRDAGEELIGSAGICWVNSAGLARYDDTGVKVPETPRKRP